MNNTATSQLSYDKVIEFFKLYRGFEKQPLNEGFNVIRTLFSDDPSLASHLCDHWKGKKREFGSFFVNLDNPAMFRFLDMWNIHIKGKEEYLKKKEEYWKSGSALELLNLQPPQQLKAITSLMVFFLNHGIAGKVTSDIHLIVLPKESKRFGNGTNWADYILSLPKEDQYDLLEKILEHADK